DRKSKSNGEFRQTHIDIMPEFPSAYDLDTCHNHTARLAGIQGVHETGPWSDFPSRQECHHRKRRNQRAVFSMIKPQNCFSPLRYSRISRRYSMKSLLSIVST